MTTETGNETGNLEAEVRDTVEQGNDVQEKVRQLTLRVISARSLDIESVRQTGSDFSGMIRALRCRPPWQPLERDGYPQAACVIDPARLCLKSVRIELVEM